MLGGDLTFNAQSGSSHRVDLFVFQKTEAMALARNCCVLWRGATILSPAVACPIHTSRILKEIEPRGEWHHVDIAETEVLADQPHGRPSARAFFHFTEHFFECKDSCTTKGESQPCS